MQIIVASVAAVILTFPHGSSSSSRPSIELRCYDRGTSLGIQELTCYRRLEDSPVDETEDPSGWSCRFSFFENGPKGRRQKLYCKNEKTGDHKLVYGDFL
ncbi:hypothetical protein EVB55_188 [Rhizobium phage RHph_Y68]|uniref:Uncharacterized protein n=1 Tax=Rhizobium phage RHph_Y68 TaxID=2509787 RepID=A0A7S5UUH6_9CAUD|nr:hypothetical protein PP934_gp188 [Rhizobium phage RHph_Y68]QIG68123.1 hypothetical protein EVB55_188 [Rhizobium phage RHph_Y68]